MLNYKHNAKLQREVGAKIMSIKATKVKDMIFFQRANGSYQSKVTVNGKRKTFYGKTKNEVRLKYQDYLKEIELDDTKLQNDIMTLNDYIEYWLKTYKLRTLEPSSYDKLEMVYLNQIKNSIGYKRLCDVTSEDIQNLINAHASPKDNFTKALAKSGLKKIRQLLDQCYKKAIQEQRVKVNPCINTYIPSDIFIDIDTKEQFSLTDVQMQELKRICLIKTKCSDYQNYKYHDGLVLLIILNTGLRSGEMLALEWEDVDLDNKVIRVNKIVQSKIVDRSNEDHKRVDRVKSGSKTFSGTRTIPINNSTVQYFKEIQKRNLSMGIQSKFVCCTTKGTRQTHRNLLRSLYTIRDKSDIIPDNVSLHTLRHTFGSTLIRNKVDVSVVSKLMGHANIMVTYNKYIHVINEEKAKAMELVEIA